jgi:hypothetical protein
MQSAYVTAQQSAQRMAYMQHKEKRPVTKQQSAQRMAYASVQERSS